GAGGELSHQRLLEHRGDQQDRVGAGGASLVDLIRVEDEVLAQDGQGDRGAHGAEVVEGALEMAVGEDRDGGGAVGGIGGGDGCGIEVGKDVALAGRGAFDLGDDGRAPGAQRADEIARWWGGEDGGADGVEGKRGATGLQLFALGGKDAVEDRAGGHQGTSWRLAARSRSRVARGRPAARISWARRTPSARVGA